MSLHRKLYLATDGNLVVILRAMCRLDVDHYTAKHGLTVLTSRRTDLARLERRGAQITEVNVAS